MTNRHVLFISRQRLVGATNGSSTYLLDLAKAVRRVGMTPHLLQPSPGVAGRWPLLSMRPEMEVFESHCIRGLVRVGRHFVVPRPGIYLAIAQALTRRLARKMGLNGAWVTDQPMPYAIAQPWSESDHRWLRQAAARLDNGGGPHIAIADYMFCSEGFADVPGVPTAIVMHDLFHTRTGGQADSVVAIDREAEVTLLARADAVLAIQATEADFLRHNVPSVDTILAPLAVQPYPTAAAGGESGHLLFVGSNTAPNVVGLEWFCENVWPQVRRALPDAVLDVAGTVAHGFVSRVPEGVRLLGLVDDLGPLYANASVVVSPLTFGSGLKIKLVEAMARGKAIVATPVTVQGVEAICSDAVRVAATPEEFALAVIALDNDPSKRLVLASAARRAAADHFSAERCHADFSAWLAQSVGAEGPDRSPEAELQNAAVAENTTVDPAIDLPFLVEEKLGCK